MLRAQGVEGIGPNSDPVREPGLPYKQQKKAVLSFSALAGKGFGFVGEAAKKAKESRGGGPFCQKPIFLFIIICDIFQRVVEFPSGFL